MNQANWIEGLLFIEDRKKFGGEVGTRLWRALNARPRGLDSAFVVAVAQLLSRVPLFATPWMAACQAPLSSMISWSLLKFMFIESTESVMLSNHPFLCPLLLLLPSIFPSIRIFPSESALHIRWPKYWSFSVSPSNEYSGLIFLRLTHLTSLQSKGFSRVFSSTTVWKHQFFSAQSSLRSYSHICTWLLEKHIFD